jgi:hypothetical protein
LSGTAGALSASITNPLDMSKLRIQVQRAQKASNSQVELYFGYKNMFHGIYLIWKNEGFLSLYKGTFTRVMMYGPQTAVAMSLTEYFKRTLYDFNNKIIA